MTSTLTTGTSSFTSNEGKVDQLSRRIVKETERVSKAGQIPGALVAPAQRAVSDP